MFRLLKKILRYFFLPQEIDGKKLEYKRKHVVDIYLSKWR